MWESQTAERVKIINFGVAECHGHVRRELADTSAEWLHVKS